MSGTLKGIVTLSPYEGSQGVDNRGRLSAGNRDSSYGEGVSLRERGERRQTKTGICQNRNYSEGP